MRSVLENLPSYRPFGQPAYGYITIKSVLAAMDTITIDGTVFTFGTDFSGTVPSRIAQGLCAAINADISVQELNTTMLPVRTFAAIYYQNTVFIYATAPGTLGNGIAMSTSNTAAVTIDANLAGGSDGNAGVSRGSLTDGSGAITTGDTAQTVFGTNNSRRYLFIQNHDASEVLWVDFDNDAVVGQPSIAIPPLEGALVFESSFVPVGTVSIIADTTGHLFTAKTA